MVLDVSKGLLGVSVAVGKSYTYFSASFPSMIRGGGWLKGLEKKSVVFKAGAKILGVD